MTNTRAEAFAPATVANLGVGFDILGLALLEPGDIVRVERCDEPGARILSITGDNGKLSKDPSRNTACVAANSILKTLNLPYGVGIVLEKGLPLASGLGSSAASSVAAAVAVNALAGDLLSLEELLPACLDGEAAVSGYHADNVAPCLFGGITLVTGTRADQIRQIPIPRSLVLALVTPNVEVPTALARSVLPQTITLKEMVAQTGAVARLIDALYREDLEKLGSAIESDCVVEPARAHLMPYLSEVRAVAKRLGALGVVISGAGPTLCAVCDSHTVARHVTDSMKDIYDRAGIACAVRVTQVAVTGARVTNVS